MVKQSSMGRWAVAAAAFAITFGAGTALAGDSPFGDDENDYEGRIEDRKRSYFGFDVRDGGDKVTNFAAYLKYDCRGNPDGEALFEARGDSLPVSNREFEGVVKQTFDSTPRRGPQVPKNLTVIYDVSGKLKSGGEATGSIEGKLRAKFQGGDTATCKATTDGRWKAKKDRDIDAPLPPMPKQ